MYPERIYGLETEYIFAGCYGPEGHQEWDAGMNKNSKLGTVFSRALQFHLPTGIHAVNGFHSNGARLYWDSHPESATPEATSIADVVASDVGNETLLLETLRSAVANADKNDPFALHDFKLTRRVVTEETSLGRHENYLVADRIFKPDEGHLEAFVAFKALGTPLNGLGYLHVGREKFYMGQKMSRVTRDYHSDTVRTKPIINTRNEPHARDYRRLHVVGVDPTSPDITAMSLGIGSLILRLSEINQQPKIATRDEWSAFAKVANTDLTFSRTYHVELDGMPTNVTMVDFHSYLAQCVGRLVEAGDCTEEEARSFTTYQFLIGQIKKAQDFIAQYNDPADKRMAQDVAIHEHLSDYLDWANKYRSLTGYWNRRVKDEGQQETSLFGSYLMAEIDIKLDGVGTAARDGLVRRLYKQPRAQMWAPLELVTQRMSEAPPGRAKVRGEFILNTTKWPGRVTVDWSNLRLGDVANPDGNLHWMLGDPYDQKPLPRILSAVRKAQYDPQHHPGWIGL